MWATSIVSKGDWNRRAFGATEIQSDAPLGGIGLVRSCTPARACRRRAAFFGNNVGDRFVRTGRSLYRSPPSSRHRRPGTKLQFRSDARFGGTSPEAPRGIGARSIGVEVPRLRTRSNGASTCFSVSDGRSIVVPRASEVPARVTVGIHLAAVLPPFDTPIVVVRVRARVIER